MKNATYILKKYFGFDSFRQHQEPVIHALLEGRSCLVLMPTGGGKSVCYQVPALMLEGIALVISPLIALMKDQVQNLQTNGIPAAFINSSMTPDEEAAMTYRCINNEFKLLYLSPEKALSVMDGWLSSLPVSLIAIDEAHCISQWGHDFRPEYTRLHLLREYFPRSPVIALTATADKTTRKDIARQLHLDEREVYISSFDRPNLSLQVRSGLRKKKKNEEIVRFIQRRSGESGIIYCLSRKMTEDMAGFLNANGIDARYYHAGMRSDERNRVQEAFIRDDVKIICATIAFGMGIDKSNIRWIIHNNIPRNLEGYYQEIGRAGRDGLKSDTVLFYNVSDLMMLTQFAKESGQAELNLQKLKRMQEYAEARICRRKILLSYFSEKYLSNCDNCDVCAHPPAIHDGTVEAQKALSALIRTGEQAGITMLINILRGSRNSDLLSKGYDKIKTYGQGKEHSFETWQSYLLQFLQLGLIEIAYDDGYALKVTPHGREVLSGKSTVEVAEISRERFDDAIDISDPEAVNEEASLFNSLRTLRKLIADSEGVAPYHIFTDKTLMEMSRQKPVTMASVLSIPGLSQRKFEKYGQDFIAVIREHLPAGYLPPSTEVENLVAPERIREYIKMMEELGIRVSCHLLGKTLLGAERGSLPETAKRLPFFGLLKGKTNYKVIGPMLRTFFTEHIESRKDRLTGSFFGGETYNHMNETAKNQLAGAIRSLPVNRPSETITNDFILAQRKSFPRSYEYWHEPEITLFRETVSRTNDLEFIASVFQRSPESIRYYYKKTFVGNDINALLNE